MARRPRETSAARRPAGRAAPEGARRHASCSRSRAATCSRSTTAAGRRASTSSTPATSRPPRSPPRAGRRSRAQPGVCALTAGPGVTNGMSALGSAQQNNSPMVVLGGRAPAMRWGQGSLQEIDHVPFVRPLTQARRDGRVDGGDPGAGRRGAARRARAAPRPGVRRLPARPRLHGGAGADARRRSPSRGPARRRRRRGRARRARCCARPSGPVIMAGTNLYWGHGEDALRALAEELRHPGLPQRPRARLRARRPRARPSPARAATALAGRRRRARRRRADGLPARLRRARSATTPRSSSIDVGRARARAPARGGRRALRRPAGDARRAARAPAAGADRHGGLGRRAARGRGRAARGRGAPSCADDRAPLHPMRVYGELGQVLDRDAIVDRRRRRLRLLRRPRRSTPTSPAAGSTPGPFGCLGSGPGYALAAKLAHPDRQVVLLLGDGAFGFAGMEFDTLARHGVDGRRRDGQQRHLGAGEAPDGVPLRLLRRRRPAPGDALRPGRRGARRPRRARARSRPSCARRSSARSRRAGRRSSTCSRTRRSPTRASNLA